jgi:ATP-dependent DNA helicase PIF1
MGNLEGIYEQGSEGIVPVLFRTGPAGCGKTYSVRAEIDKDPKFALLSATTGIAAINLGTITLNSLLRYFNTQSLEEAFFNGWLQKTILKLAEDGYKWLAIDECSMLDGLQLDILYQCIKMCNEVLSMSGKPPLGILLVGDFCQLSPVKAKWCFQAECWPFFKASTERMTKIWRQTDVRFLEAVNHIRSGRGMVGATLLHQMGVEFVKHADTTFTGTTIIAKNEAVDNFNWLCHSKIPGVPKVVSSDRWVTTGRQMPAEWNNIPQSLGLKPNAYVMILANDNPDFTFVNGDCGNIIDFDEATGDFGVRLVRNKEEVRIGRITRKVTQKEPPDELLLKYPGKAEDDLKELDFTPNTPYWDPSSGRSGLWVTGAISFYPLRLAYASTTHKCQGLTLDRIQVDLNQNFMSYPGMTYTALSRVKAPQGLRIVGSPALLGSRTHTDPLVMEWL